MMVVKRKQIVALSLFLMVLVAGYVQYNMKESSVAVGNEDEQIGDTIYVDGKAQTSKSDSSAVTASKDANDFFAYTKIQRESSRSKNSEALKTITNDTTASKDVKAKAQNEMLQMVNSANKETRIEALIKDTGISDVVTIFGDDGSVDVVVKAPSLTSSQVAKISDIVSRQANIPINKIVIKNIF